MRLVLCRWVLTIKSLRNTKYNLKLTSKMESSEARAGMVFIFFWSQLTVLLLNFKLSPTMSKEIGGDMGVAVIQMQ